MATPANSEHLERIERLAAVLRSTEGPVRFCKHTSNLFRPRERVDRVQLDATGLGHVLSIDAAGRIADVEGMTTYADLVDATLPYGLAPAVVPELKSITVGGATTVILNRYGGNGATADGLTVSTVLCIDPSYWAVRYLRKPFKRELAKTGDADKGLIVGEQSLVCRNPLGAAGIFNCAP